jgi:hypothetical protein
VIDTPRAAAAGPRRWWGLLAAVALVIAAVAYAVEDRHRDEHARPRAPVPSALPAPSASATPGAGEAAAAAAERHLAVEAILNRRETAVLTRNQQLFVQDVDPAMHAEQRVLFANLVDLRLEQLGYEQVEERYDQEVVRRHGPATYLVRVVMTYRIPRIDERPVKTELGYTFTRRTGRWMLVDDDDLDRTLGPAAHREPWDLGRYEVHRGERVTVLVDRGDGERARHIVAEARDALGDVAAYWPRR